MPKRLRGRIRRTVLFTMILLGFAAGGWALWRYHGPAPATEIYRGITYGCERAPDTDESHGLIHWVRADLSVPGVSVWTTPLNPEAQEKGFEYKLAYVSSVVPREHLAAAVNGTLFNSDSGFIRLPGDIALSLETVVSEHAVNHVDPNSYLLWGDDRNEIHFEHFKPPSQRALQAARWGISGQAPSLFPGYMTDESAVDARTVIAADPEKQVVWIACFDHASDHFAMKTVSVYGAKVGVVVDGGTSVAMAIGGGARHVRPGVITGNWRPVATQFGFKADVLP